MGFNNHAQRVAGPNYLELDNPFRQCSWTTPKKSLIQPFPDTNRFFAAKIANHNTKQLTPDESCNHEEEIIEPGFWKSLYSNDEARIFPSPWPPN